MGSLLEPIRKFREAYRSLRDLQSEMRGLRVLNGYATWRQLLREEPRYQDPRNLTRHGSRSFSQHEEDGIIAEIFRRIGTTDRFFVEFGVGAGIENNTVALLLDGWAGQWLEGSEKSVARIQKTFAVPLGQKRLRLKRAFLTAETLPNLFRECEVPAEFDLLSIDVDGNDYWFWKSLSGYRPRVVIVEYSAALGPDLAIRMKYDPKWRWDYTTRTFGCSLRAFEELGTEKGYRLVGCNITGTNAFFVREDLVDETRFQAPFTTAQHYESPKPIPFRPKRSAADDLSLFFS